jgi:uncharacterized protein (DUF169 family)
MAATDRYANLAAELGELLHLQEPPVAVTYVSEAPAGIETFAGERPSACSFWRVGEQGVVYVPAEKHFHCSVGAYTSGFELPEAVGKDLGDTIQTMAGAGYLGADEPPGIPTIKGSPRGIVYGPLREFPLAADLVLLWLSPRDAMVFDEAAGQVRWSSGGQMPVHGRPTCAALPVALQGARPALSLGCIGMRTYTEIGDDRILAVVPGAELAGFVDRLKGAAAANTAVLGVYQANKARYPVTTG